MNIMDCIYVALLSKTLYNLTVFYHAHTHTLQEARGGRAAMHGAGLIITSNLRFIVFLKETGGAGDQTSNIQPLRLADDLL